MLRLAVIWATHKGSKRINVMITLRFDFVVFAVHQTQHVERPGGFHGLDDVRVGPLAHPVLKPAGQALPEDVYVRCVTPWGQHHGGG